MVKRQQTAESSGREKEQRTVMTSESFVLFLFLHEYQFLHILLHIYAKHEGSKNGGVI